MKHKKVFREQKAITLIALIITIVVMLILAGVTINLTTGENGIFTTAQKAVQNYTNAQEKELAELNNFRDLLNNKINNIGKDETTSYYKLDTKAKPGDYVKYDGGNGYTGLWQVLYNDETNGLQIISAESVKDITLGGTTEEEAKASYNDAVNILNAECKKYVNTLYSKDANSGRCVGTNPINPDENVTETVKLQFQYNGTNESGCEIGEEEEVTDYYAMQNAKNQNEDGILDIGKVYWLASRYVSNTDERAYFFVRIHYPAGESYGNSLWHITSSGNSTPYERSYGIRPVITLASDIITNKGNGSANEPFELLPKTVTQSTLSSKAQPGDYVEYYGGNGYAGLWQVLYNDETHGLQIISAENVTDSFTLGGTTEEEAKESYNNAVNILNAECKKYVNTLYAKSGRCVGSNPISPDNDTTDTFTLEFEYNDSYESGCKVGDTNYEDDYNAMIEATKHNVNGINNIEKEYWLASRTVGSYYYGAYFTIRYVKADGNTENFYLWYGGSDGDSKPISDSFGLRPVITLTSDIKTSSGNGSAETPFKLVAK